jgi:predicted amidophosphoribosyltransferase
MPHYVCPHCGNEMPGNPVGACPDCWNAGHHGVVETCPECVEELVAFRAVTARAAEEALEEMEGIS